MRRVAIEAYPCLVRLQLADSVDPQLATFLQVTQRDHERVAHVAAIYVQHRLVTLIHVYCCEPEVRPCVPNEVAQQPDQIRVAFGAK